MSYIYFILSSIQDIMSKLVAILYDQGSNWSN